MDKTDKIMQILPRLDVPSGKLKVVIDTDTYNEVDDQFALMYALAAPERLQIEAIYAAPFYNDRSDGPGDGMEKSYGEIKRLIKAAGAKPQNRNLEKLPVLRGSVKYLPAGAEPVISAAAEDLVQRAMALPDGEQIYVIAIGAITNIASAILMEPEIINKINLVWLGGHALYWPHTREFNLMQDIAAARTVFDSGVPMIHIPALNVASHLLTSVPELQAYIGGKNTLCDTLIELFMAYEDVHFGWNKEIWDISAVACLIEPEWVNTITVSSPILTDQCTWSIDPGRHPIKTATQINRNAIFKDMYRRLSDFY